MSDNSVASIAFCNIINGELRGGDQKGHGVNPRTEDPLWAFPIASRQDLDDAVKAAQDAFQKWSRTDIKERQQVLLEIAGALSREKDLISGIVSKETGKSVGQQLVVHS